MTNTMIEKILEKPEYDFIKTNPHLGDNLIFLTLGGSHSYGTNVSTSDVDIRGVALNKPSDLIGFTEFEQVVETTTDTTVYSFNKFIKLVLNCNPNVVEMLGCKSEHYFYMTPIGELLLQNRKLFLSQRAVHSFGGYATQQLRRLENALARDTLPQSKREEHICKTMNGIMFSFKNRYPDFDTDKFLLYIDKSVREDLESEIFADISLTKFPIRQFNSILNELSNVLGNYEKLNHRNHKKDEIHLNKHAMHLIRLYLICLDILEKEDIVTYRGDPKEHELLMSIRNGKFMLEDGTYSQDFFDMVNDYEKRLEYAKKNTNLPKNPNMKQIEKLVMDVNRGVINDKK